MIYFFDIPEILDTCELHQLIDPKTIQPQQYQLLQHSSQLRK